MVAIELGLTLTCLLLQLRSRRGHISGVEQLPRAADVIRMLRFTVEAFGRLDCIFNNAGVGGGGSFLLDDRADWDQTFGVCWFGVYYCTRAFLPLLVASSGGYSTSRMPATMHKPTQTVR